MAVLKELEFEQIRKSSSNNISYRMEFEGHGYFLDHQENRYNFETAFIVEHGGMGTVVSIKALNNDFYPKVVLASLIENKVVSLDKSHELP